MALADVPLILILVGLAAYAVLGGADFGAGLWQLLAAGRARRAAPRPRPPRDGAGLGGQPRLADLRPRRLLDGLPDGVRLDRLDARVPLFIAAVGIILRGTAYALRSPAARQPREQRAIETPLRRSPRSSPRSRSARRSAGSPRAASRSATRGRSRRQLAEPDLDPDRRPRRRDRRLPRRGLPGRRRRRARATTTSARAFRAAGARQRGRRRRPGARRAAGHCARDAEPIWDGLTSGAGVAALVVSAACRGRHTRACLARHATGRRASAAALAVAAIVAGWAHRPAAATAPRADGPRGRRSRLDAGRAGHRRGRRPAHHAAGPGAALPPAAARHIRSRAARHRRAAGERACGDRVERRVILAVPVALLVVGGIVMFLSDSIWPQIAGAAAMLDLHRDHVPARGRSWRRRTRCRRRDDPPPRARIVSKRPRAPLRLLVDLLARLEHRDELRQPSCARLRLLGFL